STPFMLPAAAFGNAQRGGAHFVQNLLLFAHREFEVDEPRAQGIGLPPRFLGLVARLLGDLTSDFGGTARHFGGAAARLAGAASLLAELAHQLRLLAPVLLLVALSLGLLPPLFLGLHPSALSLRHPMRSIPPVQPFSRRRRPRTNRIRSQTEPSP